MKKSIKQQYIDLCEDKMSQAQFMRNVKMALPQHISSGNSFKDTIRILTNKGILTESKLDADCVNAQELLTGRDIEYANHIDEDLTDEDIEKLVLKNLAKDPIYYTKLKLAGEDISTGKTKKRTDLPIEVKKDNLKDKDNDMKSPKGIEKDKASSNKAKKEITKSVPVSLMSLIATSARGIQKMDATGEKTKKINIKEGQHYQSNVEYNQTEKDKIKELIDDAEFEWDEDERKSVIYSDKHAEKNIQHAAELALGLKKDSEAPEKFRSFQDKIQEIIKEIILEMYAEPEENCDCNHQVQENEDLEETKTSQLRVGDEFTLSADLGKLKQGSKVKVTSKKIDGDDIRIELTDEVGTTDDFYMDKNDDIDELN